MLAEDNAENTDVGNLDKVTLILLTALSCCIIIYRKICGKQVTE